MRHAACTSPTDSQQTMKRRQLWLCIGPDLVDGVQKVLLGDGLPPRADGEHAGLRAHAADVRAGRVGAQPAAAGARSARRARGAAAAGSTAARGARSAAGHLRRHAGPWHAGRPALADAGLRAAPDELGGPQAAPAAARRRAGSARRAGAPRLDSSSKRMSRSQFMVRVWIWKICVRLSRSGRPNSTLRSRRPGRSSAGSSVSGRLVAISTCDRARVG